MTRYADLVHVIMASRMVYHWNTEFTLPIPHWNVIAPLRAEKKLDLDLPLKFNIKNEILSFWESPLCFPEFCLKRLTTCMSSWYFYIANRSSLPLCDRGLIYYNMLLIMSLLWSRKCVTTIVTKLTDSGSHCTVVVTERFERNHVTKCTRDGALATYQKTLIFSL